MNKIQEMQSYRFSDFSKMDLTGTDFSDKDLTGTDFTGANLTECNFKNSDLTGCNFQSAIVWDCNFQNCNFTQCNFKDCKGLTVVECSGFWPTVSFQYIMEMDVVIHGKMWSEYAHFKQYRQTSEKSNNPDGWPRDQFWSMLDKLRKWYMKTHKIDRIFRDDRPLPQAYVKTTYNELPSDI